MSRRSLVPWWVAAIVLGIGAVLAVSWFALGGLPITNHAAYGRVPVPGSAVVALPAGKVVINFEEDGVIGENDSADMPGDLQVVVQGPAGPVLVSRVSANLFSISVENTGRVPYGEMVVAQAGPHGVSANGSPTSAVSPRVTFGEPPWNPFGPPIVGALLILTPFAVLAAVLILPLRRAPSAYPGPLPPPLPRTARVGGSRVAA